MENLLTARGYFWWDNELLDNEKFAPYNNVPGVLNVDHAGQPHIQLHSCLSDKISNPNPQYLRGEKSFLQDIHGILYDTDQYVCLKKVRMGESYTSSRGPSYEIMNAEYCLIGNTKRLLKKSYVFRSISLSLDPFRDWLNIQSMKLDVTSRSVRMLQKNIFRLSYKSDIGKIHLKSYLTRPVRGLHSSINIKENPVFELISRDGMNVSQIENIVRHLEEFLSLLTDAKIRMEFPTVKLRGDADPIKVFFRRPERSTHSFERSRVWIPFTLVKKDFGEIFNNFLKSYDYFGPAFHLYLGIHRQAGLYAEHKFANLVWGLESLHRRRSNIVKNAALERKIDRIIQQISNTADKKWLKRTLNASNEPNLENRIFELFSNLPFDIDRDKMRDFSRRCAHRRNDLSHFGGVRENKNEYSDFVLDIVYLSNALDILYHAKILLEIGIKDEHVKDAVCSGFQKYTHKATLAYVGIPFK